MTTVKPIEQAVLEKRGLRDPEFVESMGVVDLFNGLDRFPDGLRIVCESWGCACPANNFNPA